MSWQMAMMGAQTGLSVLGTVSSAMRGADRISKGAMMGVSAAKIRAAQGYTAAAETAFSQEGVRLQTAQQEEQRRMVMAKLEAANQIDSIGRNEQYDPGSSTSAIAAENRRIGEDDVHTIRLIGDAKVNQLSFRKRQQEMWARIQDLDAIGIGARASEATNDLWTDMGFKIAGQLLGGGLGMMNGSKGGGGKIDLASEARVTGGAGAFGLGPG